MTEPVGDAAALTDLLAEHAYEPGLLCKCGGMDWRSNGGGSAKGQHRVHVAEVLAGYVTTARAQAWDEGRDVGHEDTYLNLIEGRGDFDAAETPNPYREDTA